MAIPHFERCLDVVLVERHSFFGYSAIESNTEGMTQTRQWFDKLTMTESLFLLPFDKLRAR